MPLLLPMLHGRIRGNVFKVGRDDFVGSGVYVIKTHARHVSVNAVRRLMMGYYIIRVHYVGTEQTLKRVRRAHAVVAIVSDFGFLGSWFFFFFFRTAHQTSFRWAHRIMSSSTLTRR